MLVQVQQFDSVSNDVDRLVCRTSASKTMYTINFDVLPNIHEFKNHIFRVGTQGVFLPLLLCFFLASRPFSLPALAFEIKLEVLWFMNITPPASLMVK